MRTTTNRVHRERGFALIEVVVSFTALLVVLLGFSRMLLSSRMASATSHEATLAKEAARSMIEQLGALDVTEAYARYNSTSADDPGAGASPGAGFAVRGLEPLLDDADGLPGEIQFPEVGGVLSESLTLPQYGWPIAMNGDGDTDDPDVTADVRVLPVVVRVRYLTAGGQAVVEFTTVLGAP
jgi:type II secretory pathway pseudopilin PulG